MPGSTLGRILVVDDEIELLNSLADKLIRQGYEISRFGAPRDALAALETKSFDLILTDLMMPGMDGISLLQAARAIDPHIAGIVMTGQATVQTAVDALKLGALDYVLKPFTLSTILPALARALETRRLRLENIQLRETVGIYELCSAIAFTLDYQTLLNRVVDAAMQQCEAEEASVMLPTESGDELRVAVVRGDGRGHLLGERISFGQGVAGWVARHREPLTISGEVADPRFTPVHPRADIRAAISLPMMVGGRLVGILNVNSTSRRRPFTMGQVKALGILANTGAAALESARLHAAVQRAEEQYRSIFEHASEGILQTTPAGRVEELANPAAARILGYASPEDLITRVQDLGAQVYRRAADRVEVVRAIEEHGRVRQVEIEMVRKDGGRVWVSLTGRAVRDRVGQIMRYESTLTDITRRKRAEQLSAAEHRVARVLAEAPAVSEALDRVLRAIGEALEWDRCELWRVSAADLLLYREREWDARGAGPAEPAPARPLGSGLVGTAWETGRPAWGPPDGIAGTDSRSVAAVPVRVGEEVRYIVELLGREPRDPDPAVLATLGVIATQVGQFIDRRRLEEERDRFFELSVDLLCVAGNDGVFQVVNPAWEDTLGWLPNELTSRPYMEFVHPDDVAATVAEAHRLAAGGGRALVFENRYRCRDGSYRWLSWRAVADPGRQVLYASARDTTEKRRAEAELLLRDRAIKAATQGIVITDAGEPDNPILFATPGFERMTGYSLADVIGRNCRLLQGKETDPVAVARIRQAIRTGVPCTVDLLNYRKDGMPFWNELSVSPVKDDDGRVTHFVGVLTDVSNRHQLEHQLRQSQKMEAIGKLAGGVAHDFNNLLTVIMGYSSLLLDRMAVEDPSYELISEIRLAGERSASLTRQLLAFSRQQILAPRVLDLNQVITDTEKMLTRLIGEDVKLTTVRRPGLWRVRADPGQIEQVLLNLAVNARDAMPTGGKLTIETANVDLDEGYAGMHPDAQSGPHVLLAVADTGCGMSQELMARIFEPFFTTKGPTKGTGLGLATVHGIVKQSGGHIGVYSEVGVGTTFKVYLPRAEGADSAVRPRLIVRGLQKGVETVLLVEDEDAVRALSRLILSQCGYTVLEAANGEEAIQIAAGHGAPIHLLVTDVVMPGQNGRSVAEQIVAYHPEVRVLFVSGYTDDAVVRHGILEAGVNYLQKPFPPAVLVGKVREILDAPR